MNEGGVLEQETPLRILKQIEELSDGGREMVPVWESAR